MLPPGVLHPRSPFSVPAALLVFCWCCSSIAAPAAESGAATNSNSTSIALEALSRLKNVDLEANPAVKAAVLKVLEQVRGTPQFVEIIRDFKIKGEQKGLLEVAAREPASSAGVEAMRLVLNEGETELIRHALAETNAVRIAEALGNTGDNQIVPLLLPIASDSARDTALRQQAVRALAQVQPGAMAVLDLARQQKLPAELELTASFALNQARWEDIKAKARELLPLPQSKDARPLPPISELIKWKGDRENGSKVFRSETVACNKCHQINGEGIDFGPNLSEIGGKLGKDALFQAILDPSAGISFGYEAWLLTLKNGNETYGIIVSETAEEISIKAVGGFVTRYPKSEIASRAQQKLSSMPAGLQQLMSAQQLVDLVEYLGSLKKAAH